MHERREYEYERPSRSVAPQPVSGQLHYDPSYDHSDDGTDSEDDRVESFLDSLVDRFGRKRTRDRPPKFDIRLASSLPGQKEVGIDSLIRQIDSLFHYEEHKVQAAKLKLDESTLFLVDAEERRGIRVNWMTLKSILSSKRKTGGSLTDFNTFQQKEGEPISVAWDRLLSIARNVDSDMSTSQLWDYFRERLTSGAMALSRGELGNPDPFTALSEIKKWGDGMVSLAQPPKSIFKVEVEDPTPYGRNKSGTKVIICYECQKAGHFARNCPDRGHVPSRPSSPSQSQSDEQRPHFHGRGGGGGSHHKGRGGNRGSNRGRGGKGGKHWPKKPKPDDTEPKNKPSDEPVRALTLGVGCALAPTAVAGPAAGSAASVVRAFSGL